MSYTIAVTGKGGVGKTTISGLLIGRLIANGRLPVLAVDADANSCLHTVLGVKVENSVGRIREEARVEASKGKVTGIAKQQMLEMKIAECLVEAKNFDLIAMGRPEGPGCYCFANNVLRDVIRKLSSAYPYVIIDNEAGLENLSRRIVQKVDLLVMVADPSKNGIETVRRLHKLAFEMDIEFKRLCIFINRSRNGKLPDEALFLKNETEAEFVIALPDNHEIASLSEKGESVLALTQENEIVGMMDEFIKKLF
ncbi:MAG: AAA family ATPase [Lentisphaerae bacterium]|nr:AAA family ATPase [Lentisphaerota bacterium]